MKQPVGRLQGLASIVIIRLVPHLPSLWRVSTAHPALVLLGIPIWTFVLLALCTHCSQSCATYNLFFDRRFQLA